MFRVTFTSLNMVPKLNARLKTFTLRLDSLPYHESQEDYR